MLGYTILGTKDLGKAKEFYDPLFKRMNLARCYEDALVASLGDENDHTVPRFFVCYPYNERPASAGNGSMTAFRVERASDVDELYEMAIQSGGQDEGKPGFRPEAYGDKFYVAYVRDLDGNKLAFCCYDGKANP
ncbi:VOC family protein [Aestuariibius insulae]|uniref:VOC family protein n=1 Tax=Aestuariibius insulae TaxID=2058287 RepID=UPI00398F5925